MDSANRATGQMGEYGFRSSERSAGEIVKDIIANGQEIIRSEIRLAKAELREETRKAIRSSILAGAGGVIALYGLGFLLAAAVAALSLVMPWWAATLIVAVVLLATGGILLSVGLKRWKQVHIPEKTIADVKENVEWLKRQTKL